MDRTRKIDHEGKEIYVFDFSNLKTESESLPIIETAMEFIGPEEPEGSLLTMTLAHDAEFNAQVASKLWALVKHNKPYVKAAAIVGIGSTLQKQLVEFISTMSKREFRVFDTEQEAKDWLVTVE